jgi:hypothetical protein
MWQIFKFGPKDRKRRFELEFVIIKSMLRRKLLIFKGLPIRMVTNFTSVSTVFSHLTNLLVEISTTLIYKIDNWSYCEKKLQLVTHALRAEKNFNQRLSQRRKKKHEKKN